MLYIITPCYRQCNIPRLYESIEFDKIHKWIIIYDTSNDRKYNKLYEHDEKIIEMECNDEGIYGNPQRNYGMTFVSNGFIYFLDDDNIIHPNFWSIIDLLDNSKFYTFDQLRDIKNESILHGNNIAIGSIDTAMFIVHTNHIKDIKWKIDEYTADGCFICDILNQNTSSHTYINTVGCYYNFLQSS